MPITDINELSHDAITDEQILGYINALSVRYHELMFGAEFMHDQRENGDAGFEVKPTATLAEIRAAIQMWSKMLADPASRGDVAYLRSQFDNPDL